MHLFHKWSKWGDPKLDTYRYAFQRKECSICGKIVTRYL